MSLFLSRRRFLGGMLATLLLTSCVHKPVNWSGIQEGIQRGEFKAPIPGSYPIIQGPTGQWTSRVNVLRPRSEDLKYFVKAADVVLEIPAQQESLTHKGWAMDHLDITVKKADALNTLYIFDSKGRLKDQRSFGFLNPEKENIRLLVASCMHDMYADIQKEMWNEAHIQNADAMLFIGDNVYADSDREGKKIENPTPQILARRYFETRMNLDIYRKYHLTPIFSTWDDHDYGMNGGGVSFKYKAESTALFKSYFPMNGIEGIYENGPGIASKLKLKNADVFILDNRSFRDGPDADGVTGTHFGKEQEDWIFKNLDSKKLTFLVSGDQWFGAYHPFESYEGLHKTSFENFLKRLKKANSKVVFVSGDRHLTEVMKIPASYTGRETYEITSSGIHAKMYPGSLKKAPSPKQIVGVDGRVNFALIEFGNAKPPTHMKVKSQGQRSETLFEKTLKLP